MYQKLYIPPMQKWVFVFLAIAVLLLAAFTPAVFAEEKSDGQSAWKFYVAPYVWALSADGNVTVKGIKADVDVPFSDIRDQLNIAAMVEYGGRKGNWGVWGHTIYANLGKDTTEKKGEIFEIDKIKTKRKPKLVPSLA